VWGRAPFDTKKLEHELKRIKASVKDGANVLNIKGFKMQKVIFRS